MRSNRGPFRELQARRCNKKKLVLNVCEAEAIATRKPSTRLSRAVEPSPLSNHALATIQYVLMTEGKLRKVHERNITSETGYAGLSRSSETVRPRLLPHPAKSVRGM